MGKTIGKVTQAQIDDWKQSNKHVLQCVQTDEEGNIHYTYFRKPGIADIQYAGAVGKEDGLAVGIALFSQVRLGGSEVVMEDDQLKQGVMSEVLKVSKPIAGEITKL